MDINIKNIRSIDYILSVVCIILSIIAFIFFSNNGSTTYAIICILPASIFILWIAFLRKRLLDFSKQIAYSSNLRVFKISIIIFFVCLLFLIIGIYLRSVDIQRPSTAPFLMAIMAGTTSFCGLNARERWQTYGVLSQISILALASAWSIMTLFPSVIGVDPIWHNHFSQNIILDGNIPTGFNYSNTCLMHIIIAEFSIIGSISSSLSYQIIINSVQTVLYPIMIFSIATKLYNIKIGLLASLICAFSPYIILSSWWSIPSSFGGLLLLTGLIIVLLPKSNRGNIYFILLFLIVFSMNLMHPLPPLWFIILLTIIILFRYIDPINRYKDDKPYTSVHYRIIILFAVISVGWWTYSSGYLTTFSNLLTWGFRIDNMYQSNVGMTSSTYSWVTTIISNIGLASISAIGLIGCLVIIKLNNVKNRWLGLSALFTLGGAFIILSMKFINVDRWLFFAAIMICIPCAIALVTLMSEKKPKLSLAFVVSIIIIISLTSFISPVANNGSDNFLNESSVRFGFDNSEIIAIQSLSSFYSGIIKGDNNYIYNIGSSVPVNYAGVEHINCVAMDEELNNATFSSDGSMIAIRNQVAYDNFIVENGVSRLNYNIHSVMCDEGFNRIMNSGKVSIYT